MVRDRENERKHDQEVKLQLAALSRCIGKPLDMDIYISDSAFREVGEIVTREMIFHLYGIHTSKIRFYYGGKSKLRRDVEF